MNKIKLCKPYDAIDYLDSKEDYALYLQSCFENDPGDCSLIKSAILDIAQAKGLAEVARESGLAGDCLCKALGSEGRLEFERQALSPDCYAREPSSRRLLRLSCR